MEEPTSSTRRRTIVRLPTAQGYIRIFAPGHPMSMSDGWALEHRVVAHDAGLLPLGSGLSVHHVNHDKTDNRLENLLVVTPREHSRIHAAERPPKPIRPRVQKERKRRSDYRSHPEAVALYESGLSTVEVARHLGVHSSVVSRWLAREGVSTRSARSRDVMIVAAYMSSLSTRSVAAEFGIDHGTVSRVLQRAGLPTRPKGCRFFCGICRRWDRSETVHNACVEEPEPPFDEPAPEPGNQLNIDWLQRINNTYGQGDDE